MDDLPPEYLRFLRADLEREWTPGLTPQEWNRHFLSHYFARFAPADFHSHFDTDLRGLHTRRGSRLSYIAPRGGAKSTWCTLAYPLRAALEGWEPYTTILSDSSEQANELLRHIKGELTDNEMIAEVYPDAAGEGPEWRENRIRLRNGAVIESLGTGKKIRGRRNRAERPSLVVLDDIQSNEDVISPTLRQRAWDWVTREVIPAGDERTNFLAVGSAIHPEAVSVRVGELAGWSGRTFAAIHSWPDRMDLWDEFARLATNLADEKRAETARAYYLSHRAAMDAGSRHYWPARFDLSHLMLKRAEVGHLAFQSEYQSVPSTVEGAEFKAEYFGDDVWFDGWPDGSELKVISLDPSKGTSGKGKDYQAHVMLSVVLENQRYVIYVDAVMLREGVADMVERTVSLFKTFSAGRVVDSVYAEENGTMGLLKEHFDIAAARANVYLPYKLVNNTENKDSRIRQALSTPLARKQLRFRRTAGCRMLVAQLREWPNSDHDDGPDALASGLRRVAELLS